MRFNSNKDVDRICLHKSTYCLHYLFTLPAFSLGTIFSSSYIVKIEIKAKQKGNVRLKTAGVCKYIRAHLIFFKMPNSISLHFTTTTQIGFLRKNINKIGL